MNKIKRIFYFSKENIVPPQFVCYNCITTNNFTIIFVASEASDLLFKTIISHVTPYGPQVFTQGFSELSAGGGGGGGGEGAVNSSKTAMYFGKPVMEDGSSY